MKFTELIDRLDDITADAVNNRRSAEESVAALRAELLTTDELSPWVAPRPTPEGSLSEQRKTVGPDVLAAGPAFGGEGTTPYRDVVLRWEDGSFSVHRQCLDSGAFDSGKYFENTSHHGFWRAVLAWQKKVADCIAEQGRGCFLLHDFNPEGLRP